MCCTQKVDVINLCRTKFITSYMLKVANFNLPHLHLVPPLGVTLFEFCRDLQHHKTKVPGLLRGIVCVILRIAISVKHRLVTDRHDSGIYHASMASLGKKAPLYSCPWLHQMLTYFQDSLTMWLSHTPAIRIPPHLTNVATLPCEIHGTFPLSDQRPISVSRLQASKVLNTVLYHIAANGWQY